MELWWHLRGWTRLRLTSANCAGRLRAISGEMRLGDIHFPDELTAEFSVQSGQEKLLLDRFGAELGVIGVGGIPALAKRIWCWRRLAGLVLILGILTVALPKRVWFVRVEGNSFVPDRRILEAAEMCGVSFGASAGAIRSEQVKNKLLYEIPELRWAGVNTQGCTAVITVAERRMEEQTAPWQPGSLVAGTDGIVTEVILQRGSALVKPGSAVREGQLLISGVTDLGICTRLEQAEGEIWAMTRREIQVSLPAESVKRGETSAVKRKFSLRIGKKSVNFSNDSGILYGTCVKMRTVDYLVLPGGFCLPVALVTDTYYQCQTESLPREETDWYAEAARRTVRERLRAGSVRTERLTQEGNLLTAVYECREQIGVFRPGEYMERDTFDRENGECGAG